MTTDSSIQSELEALPPPESITLFLKCHKSTVLISVTPDTSFMKIKQLLLAALQARQISTMPGTSIPIPTDPEDFEFASLRDKKDFTKGWVALDAKDQETADNKSVKRKGAGKSNIHSDSPAGAGLSDGSLIAYRIKLDKQHQDDEDAMDDVLADPGWDVLFPTYDEEDPTT